MRDIEKVMKRVRALLAKTLENGATEAEALEAAQKAAELMSRYRIDQADLRVAEEGFGQHRVVAKAQWHVPAYKFIAPAVGELTGTVPLQIRRDRTAVVCFYGRESDALFAQWLCQALGDFTIAGLLADEKAGRSGALAMSPGAGQLLRKAVRAHQTRWRNGYLIGAASRISERIKAILQAQRAAYQASSNALALLNRQEQALAHYESANDTLSEARAGKRTASPSGFAAGTARGDQAQFHRPVEHGGHFALERGGGR